MPHSRRLHRSFPFVAPITAFLLAAPLYSCAPSDAAASNSEESSGTAIVQKDAAPKDPARAVPAGVTDAAGGAALPAGSGTAATAPTTASPNEVSPAGDKTVPVDELGRGTYKIERPAVVKGIYLTAWSAGSSKKMDQMIDLINRTELNAVVIDVRDHGDVFWKTGIKLAEETGATKKAVANPVKLFTRLEKHQIWPIARVAIFRDNHVTKKYPKRAVQKTDGSIWRDRGGQAWLDPYNKENWEYIAEQIDFAMDIGFKEIQLDYVRFPSEGKMSSMRFPAKASYPKKDVHPSEVIVDFCNFIKERVKARGVEYSADIFGIISSGTADQGIGQTLETIVTPFDVVSPMVYPSHYAKGEYGIKDPNRQPYETIKKSLADYKRRVPDVKVRPWLQDFSLFGVKYGPAEVKAQIKAMREVGYEEFLLWNASNRYTESALDKAEKTPQKSKDSTQSN